MLLQDIWIPLIPAVLALIVTSSSILIYTGYQSSNTNSSEGRGQKETHALKRRIK
ncbi:hypothetical protein I8752_04145 [Nostocaceae cyanobacterium CENA369]|uniref:Uncharacterized protein n=1 Tax=Dendronalium phyllosphericum CENA369 TaxID=1725256 RepID=A0A8J7I160_9NOST|nr:hypothetical protein [Dendronalium phyllosphericum]MBH8572238.1 hypothetical protein [Dendronalium phyllosphericum CENA369]